jgi:hypothetical protein
MDERARIARGSWFATLLSEATLQYFRLSFTRSEGRDALANQHDDRTIHHEIEDLL